MTKKTKSEPAYTSLAIKKIDELKYVLVSHIHDENGVVLDIQEAEPLPFHLVVHDMKLCASRLWRP